MSEHQLVVTDIPRMFFIDVFHVDTFTVYIHVKGVFICLLSYWNQGLEFYYCFWIEPLILVLYVVADAKKIE